MGDEEVAPPPTKDKSIAYSKSGQTCNLPFMKTVVIGKDQCARTPRPYYAVICRLFFGHEDSTIFDPCPPNPQFDGLQMPWKPCTFVNPPFNELRAWANKAVHETQARSIVLMPTRTSTSYMHQLVHANASHLVIWLNRVAFPPHKLPFTLPVLTAGFHFPPGSQLHQVPGVLLYKIHIRAWELRKSQPEKYWPLLQTKVRAAYGIPVPDYGNRQVLNMPSSGGTFVCVMNSPSDTLQAIHDHLEVNPQSFVVAMVIPCFSAKYFRKMMPYVKQLVFLKPNLMFDTRTGARSILGSVIMLFAGKEVTEEQYLVSSHQDQPNERIVTEGYFADWLDGKIFRER